MQFACKYHPLVSFKHRDLILFSFFTPAQATSFSSVQLCPFRAASPANNNRGST